MEGIGLEGHFTVPNPPLIRAVLDKLAILKLPIWLTEVDISKNLDKEIQIRENITANSTFSLCRGDDTKHLKEITTREKRDS
uniref:Endo-1,4-beta-xylanase A n=1 Tax=Solanum tuberosum TaxID=4113 RepID=M1DT08_SOLTU